MDDGQEQYIHQVLEAYRKTPGTTGTIRKLGIGVGTAARTLQAVPKVRSDEVEH